MLSFLKFLFPLFLDLLKVNFKLVAEAQIHSGDALAHLRPRVQGDGSDAFDVGEQFKNAVRTRPLSQEELDPGANDPGFLLVFGVLDILMVSSGESVHIITRKNL